MTTLRMIFVVAAVLAAVFGVFSAAAQPALTLVKGETLDWGKVTPATPKLSAQIELKNTGTEDLVISKPTTSCGCTVAEPEKNTLKPGETTMMTVTMDITGKSGEMTKTVNIPSNDPAQPTAVLTVMANIFTPLEVMPKLFSLNQLETGKKSSVKISLKNLATHVITVKPGECFKVSLGMKKPLKIQPGKTVEVEASVVPDQKGTMTVSAEFITDDNDLPKITVKGYCNVVK